MHVLCPPEPCINNPMNRRAHRMVKNGICKMGSAKTFPGRHVRTWAYWVFLFESGRVLSANDHWDRIGKYTCLNMVENLNFNGFGLEI